MIWSGPGAGRALLAEALGQPVHERRGLLGEAEPQERVQREGRVADPRVAVVVVPHAADVLGQARRRRGDDRARRPVRHQLERQRRAVDHLAPAALVAALRRASGASSCDRLLERLPRLALRVLARDVASRAPARARRSPSRPGSSVNSPYAPSCAKSIGTRVSSASESCGERKRTPALVEDRLVLLAAVVEARLHVHAEAHLAAHAEDAPDQPVAMLGRALRDRHEVLHLADAGRGQEARDEDVRVREVELLRAPSRRWTGAMR